MTTRLQIHDSEIFFNSEQTKNLSQHSEKMSTYSVYSRQLLSFFLTNLSPPYYTRRSKPLCISALIKSAPKRLRGILCRILHTLYGKNIFVPLSPYHPTEPDGDNPLRICVGKSVPKRVRRRLAVNICIFQAGLSYLVMVSKKRKRVELSPASDGSDAAGDPGGNYANGTKKYTKILGFYNEGIPRTLYQIWRTAMHHAMAKFSSYGPGETGRDRFTWFGEWGATHPAMAPRRQINYHEESCRSALNQLMQDVAKKVRKSRQVIWEAIADAQAAFATENTNIAIELVDRLPDMGATTAQPAYMPANPESTKARTESAAEGQRAAA